MILVTGGSASGKSAYAEQRIAEEDGIPTYLATMRRGSAEAEERIRKHLRQREGKGFLTVECPVKIGTVLHRCTEAVLLEDLGNLVANEMFGEVFEESVAERIGADIRKLRESRKQLVIVTDEVFSDGGVYDGQTMQYIKELARLNKICAGLADEVWEVVCGIPVRVK